jgi:hypothetical protein
MSPCETSNRFVFGGKNRSPPLASHVTGFSVSAVDFQLMWADRMRVRELGKGE